MSPFSCQELLTGCLLGSRFAAAVWSSLPSSEGSCPSPALTLPVPIATQTSGWRCRPTSAWRSPSSPATAAAPASPVRSSCSLNDIRCVCVFLLCPIVCVRSECVCCSALPESGVVARALTTELTFAVVVCRVSIATLTHRLRHGDVPLRRGLRRRRCAGGPCSTRSIALPLLHSVPSTSSLRCACELASSSGRLAALWPQRPCSGLVFRWISLSVRACVSRSLSVAQAPRAQGQAYAPLELQVVPNSAVDGAAGAGAGAAVPGQV